MKKGFIALLMATVASVCSAHENPALEKRVAELEKEVAELKVTIAPIMAKGKAEQIVVEQRDKAKARMRQDSEHYSRDELRKIETLYQVANKNWKTQDGKDSLEILIEKYDHANRTGCALLYLGQMNKGDEREEYLKRAIDDFSDCYYGDGVQVGAYARYHLAYYYKEAGKQDKAEELFAEIKELYPDAISHKGGLLSDSINN
ncbi:MAG: hypothetical protein DRP64_19825 [Verrucomicrobia bacterium]|nr:MAG: hypothetical protein DRP64_19825 [Verrucomicrobiota bacterium]